MSPLSLLAEIVIRHRRAVLIAAAIAVLAGLALTPVFPSKLRGVGATCACGPSRRRRSC